MLRSLVVLDLENGQLESTGLALLAKLSGFRSEPDAVVFGSGGGQVAASLGRYGCKTVYWSDQPELETGLAQPRVDAVAGLADVEGYDAIVMANSPVNADLAAGLAVRLRAGVNWDLLDLGYENSRLTGTKGALDDSLLIDVGWTTPVKIGVVRAQSLELVNSANPAVTELRSYRAEFAPHSLRVRLTGEAAPEAGDAGQLATASVIVAGGRGLAHREDFQQLEELAEALGGIVGVSMPIVDQGWYPHSRQIGQTGTTVRPKLYLAVGISGAIQHRVGMGKSGTIVAINSDPTAPILGIADLGIVGDWKAIVPELLAAFRARVRQP